MLTFAYVRGVEIRCSIPVLLLLPAAAAFGRLETACVLMFSLTMHEFAHAVMAERLGSRIHSMELQPFGFIARLQNSPATAGDAIAISTAGPMASLFMAMSAAGIMYLTNDIRPILSQFAAFNLSLGLINLIPVLPLDGGRLFAAIFERRLGKVRAVRLFAAFGGVFGATCALFGILLIAKGIANPSPLITGIFVMLAAFAERKTVAISGAKSKLMQGATLRSGRALTVHTTAMSANTTVRDALRTVTNSGYNVIILLDSSCRSIGTIDEGVLFDAMYKGLSERTLHEAISMLSRTKGHFCMSFEDDPTPSDRIKNSEN
ncbi:MAG: M50 family metallopeptidase [Christensenellaceae bacterium]|nr:M50 family metallopeptidase [Christensenellaceae bacterium]